MKERIQKFVDENASVTTSGNAGAYTKPLAYSSKSMPVLINDFIARFDMNRESTDPSSDE